MLVLAAVWWRSALGLASLVAACGQVNVDGGGSEPDASPIADAAPVDARPTIDAAPDADPGDRLIFVTSQSFVGNLGGFSGADERCRSAAEAAGLRGSFMAWLADSTGSPATRLRQHPGPFLRTDGIMVAASWTDLTDGTLLAPIDRDENGAVSEGTFICKGGEVWTSTTASGELKAPGSHCQDWSINDATATAGNVQFTDSRWADSGCTSITCQSDLPLYCVQQ